MPTATSSFQPGKLVSLRGRDWVVQASPDPELLLLRPLGGSEEETTGLFLPATPRHELPVDAEFPLPTSDDLGNFAHARLLYNAARLSFRSGAGPFRSLAKLSFRPRSYQMVPLVMALRQQITRLLVADDVGIGKTIEALLIIAELLERRVIDRFAVVCLPHLCDQWQQEIRDKIGLDAVVIRSNTQARLDRQVHGDTSVYQHYPFQIISIDYIKSDQRRQVFISECPELIVIDEAHTCARPQGASKGQQQRYALLRDIIDSKPDQHLVMLTATPHSGKQEEFGSLLGLLDDSFETVDVATAGQAERKRLAGYFVQRRRGDVEKWMKQKTPFPDRDSGEFNYNLSSHYAAFFDRVFQFARSLVTGEGSDRQKRVHYWTALGMLRGVMSSPAAGITLLRNRRSKLSEDEIIDQDAGNLVHDSPEGFESDIAPAELVEATDWTDYQLRKLRDLEKELEGLIGIEQDYKLEAARMVIDDWLKAKFCPVVFCRYIATANYLGEQLKPLLESDFPGVDVQVVTSEDPDELRKERIDAMGNSKLRVLVATDCLSEGINLHDHFSAVLHYDLPWNPNRLEQREGRVDRFGQTRDEVKAYLLFSQDNPVDGAVLNVILRKVREIKKVTGINVPFPEDSRGVIDAIAQSLLIDESNKVTVQKGDANQLEISFEEFDTAKKIDIEVTDKFKRSAENVKASRSIFAQHGIKEEELEPDLRENDEAIGDPEAVTAFTLETINSLYGAQTEPLRGKKGAVNGYRLFTINLPAVTRSALPEPDKRGTVAVSFESPTPEGFHYLGRNHAFVEQLCQRVLADTMAGEHTGASRAAAFRTSKVDTMTTLLLFRVRNVIEEDKKGGNQLVAEEMLLWGYRGTPSNGDFIDRKEAQQLLNEATIDGELSVERRQRLLTDQLDSLPDIREKFDQIAEARSKHLVEAHERFSRLIAKKRFQVVYPVLPMDVLGVYILLPNKP